MPGTRAPHVMLTRAGKPVSTLDLFTRNFSVVAAPDGGVWCDFARAAAPGLGLALDAYRPDRDGDIADPEGRLAAAYDLSPSGAVIIRPDGFVAWRARDAATASKATMTSVAVVAAVPKFELTRGGRGAITIR